MISWRLHFHIQLHIFMPEVSQGKRALAFILSCPVAFHGSVNILAWIVNTIFNPMLRIPVTKLTQPNK
jgi:hypothetical protein